MSKSVKSLLLNFVCFAVLFLVSRYVLGQYTHLSGVWKPITAFVISTIISPQFKAIKTHEGEKIFMKWLFMKGVKEIK
ncbi:hypothetical protein GCM10011508_23680 [Flavobacterium lutivivi]|nr:hypothetical protein GCM10011508_23680 [Flavobacterium lutivivi]